MSDKLERELWDKIAASIEAAAEYAVAVVCEELKLVTAESEQVSKVERKPRVWRKGDPEPPSDVTAVRHSNSQIFRRAPMLYNSDRWQAGTGLDLTWGALTQRLGNYELTEWTSAPEGPRVWRDGDPEPCERGLRLRDKDRDVWVRRATGVWESPDTAPCGWSYITRKFAPLTEVVDSK